MTPDWVSVGFTAAGALVMVGVYFGTLRGMQQDRDEDRNTSAEWRKDMKTEVDAVRRDLQALLVVNPVTAEKIGHLQQEQDFQRGRIHELSNQVVRVDSKHEERFNSIARRVDRLALDTGK